MNVSNHAVDRWIERVKPGIDPEQARAELEALANNGFPVVTEPPGWLVGDDREIPEGFIEVCDGVLLPVRNGIVTTVLTRGKNNTEQAKQKRIQRHLRKQRQLKRKKERLARAGRLEKELGE